jgi:sugar-specific transcriptional regulator TrmB
MATGRARPEFDSTIKGLVEVGLTLNEARCYLALLNTGPATAAELAKVSGVPRPKVYATLKSLEQRSFSYPSADQVTKFRPVDPELALAELTRSREHERRLADERDRQLRSELVSVLPPPPEQPVEERGEIMRLTGSRGSTIYEQMIESAERRVDIVHGLPMLQESSHFNQFEVAAAKRGVQLRVLFPDVELAVEHRYGEIAEAGGEVRVARGAPLKLLIRDRVEAMVALRNPGDPLHPTCVAISHADLVAPLQLLFSREWRPAKPLEPVAA